jgi:hypothetical protein
VGAVARIQELRSEFIFDADVLDSIDVDAVDVG